MSDTRDAWARTWPADAILLVVGALAVGALAAVLLPIPQPLLLWLAPPGALMTLWAAHAPHPTTRAAASAATPPARVALARAGPWLPGLALLLAGLAPWEARAHALLVVATTLAVALAVRAHRLRTPRPAPAWLTLPAAALLVYGADLAGHALTHAPLTLTVRPTPLRVDALTVGAGLACLAAATAAVALRHALAWPKRPDATPHALIVCLALAGLLLEAPPGATAPAEIALLAMGITGAVAGADRADPRRGAEHPLTWAAVLALVTGAGAGLDRHPDGAVTLDPTPLLEGLHVARDLALLRVLQAVTRPGAPALALALVPVAALRALPTLDVHLDRATDATLAVAAVALAVTLHLKTTRPEPPLVVRIRNLDADD